MPTVLRSGPYRFHFYASDRNEPRHVHVSRDAADAKFWLDPVELADNRGFNAKVLRDIQQIIEAKLQTLRNAWDDFFNP